MSLMPSAKIFHYGQSIFEGMKAYKDNASNTWLFRPVENYIRLNKSAKRLAIPEIPKNIFSIFSLWIFEVFAKNILKVR